MKWQMTCMFDYQSIGWKRSSYVSVGMIWKDGLQHCFDTIERADQLVNQVTTVVTLLDIRFKKCR